MSGAAGRDTLPSSSDGMKTDAKDNCLLRDALHARRVLVLIAAIGAGGVAVSAAWPHRPTASAAVVSSCRPSGGLSAALGLALSAVAALMLWNHCGPIVSLAVRRIGVAAVRGVVSERRDSHLRSSRQGGLYGP